MNPPHPDRPLFALGLRIGGIAMISTMFMLAKLVGQSGVALPEMMFWRQLVPVFVLGGWLWATGRLWVLRTERIGRHAIRATTGMFGMSCGFGAAVLLPLAESTTLGFTTPLFAVILTALFLKERVGPWRWTAVLFGFAGVLVVTRPGGEAIDPLGTAAGLMSGLMVAIISFQIRDLARSDGPTAVVFWFSLFGAAIMAVPLPFFITPHSLYQWALLAGIGISGTIGQLLISASLRLGAVASVVVMDYTALVWATLFGWTIWDHMPPATTWIGAPLIIGAGLVVAWREHHLARKARRSYDPSPASSLEMD